MDCECFWHPQIYTEDDAQLQRDAQWHVTHAEERNIGFSTDLLDAVERPVPPFDLLKPIKSFIEIGAATGTMLHVAANRGMEAVGFDTNPFAVQVAKERHGITIRQELWDRDTIQRSYDAVFCISVLEHLTQPQALVAEIAAYCVRHGASAFVTVPFRSDRNDWQYLLEENAETIKNPFYLSDVHINHFSRFGFVRMFQRAGAKIVQPLARGWHGYWMGF